MMRNTICGINAIGGIQPFGDFGDASRTGHLQRRFGTRPCPALQGEWAKAFEMVAVQMRQPHALHFIQRHPHQGQCFARTFTHVEDEQLAIGDNHRASGGAIAAR
jgi:hypothetical protein